MTTFDRLNKSLFEFKKAFLELPPTTNQFYIALSGGMDSCILLHATKTLLTTKKLTAIHVNHEIESESYNWEKHCIKICNQLKIPIIIRRIGHQLHTAQHLKNSEGPEDAARKARYAVFKTLLKPNDCLLIAHHLEDQAETLLIQLARSSGFRGLAGMPLLQRREKIYYFRPLLNWSREHRLEYAKQYALQWIEDPSNLNERFTRNFIRHQVVPVLQTRWPNISRSLAKTALHCAQTLALCDEFAEQDLKLLIPQQNHTWQLFIEPLYLLSSYRRKNVLRFWLKKIINISMSTSQFDLFETFLYSKKSYQTFTLKTIIFQKYRQFLYALSANSFNTRSAYPLQWHFKEPLFIPNWGTLTATFVKGKGIRSSLLNDTTVLEVRFRVGGERFHPQERGGSHPLKKLFQEWAILPWQRHTVPLIYFNNQLIAVAEHSVSKTASAQPDELGLLVSTITN